MLEKTFRFWLILSLLLIISLACLTPGLTAAPPAPALDQNSLSTIIAGTANAAAAQTAAANPSTPIPQATVTETASPAPSPTVTPRLSAEGTSLTKQSDGSYAFVDQQGGYSLIVPANWLAIRINEQEFINAWTLPEASDPRIQSTLTLYQKQDPKLFRLFGLDLLPEHVNTGFVTNFNITWDRNNNDSLAQTIQSLKSQLPRSATKPKITYADIGTTSSQIPMGIIEDTFTGTASGGGKLQIYQKLVLFKLKAGMLSITLSTTSDLKSGLEPGFDLMTDQIKIFP